MEGKKRSGKRWMGRRDFLKLTGFLGVLLLLGLWGSPISSASAAEVYPADKIRWIIPYSPGGGFDLIARGLTPFLTKYLREASPKARGGELMIKNEPGASGQKAYSITYGSRPDGLVNMAVIQQYLDYQDKPLEFRIGDRKGVSQARPLAPRK